MSQNVNRNSISINSANSQTSLQSSNNSRVFDFEGLEESLVDDRNDSDDDDDVDDDFQTLPNEQHFHRIRNALIRDSQNRSDEDLDLIHDFLALIARQKTTQTTLNDKDYATRRLLAKHMVLAEIESRDTRVLTHGERLDAYCVVACGSLRHVMHTSSHTTPEDDDSCVDCVDGECVSSRVSSCVVSEASKTRFLTIGDEFGASLDDRVVFGEIFTNEDFVWVLCVPHVIFDDICGQKTFRTLFDENNEKILEIRNQTNNELIRATKERLLELLFASDDNSSSCETTLDDSTSFIADFLLTFRLFLGPKEESVRQLLERVIDNLENERNVEKNVKISLFWISNHFHDFRDKALLRALSAAIRDKLHKKLFYFTLSSKSRERHVTLTRSERAAPLPFSLIGGYECSSRLFVDDVIEEECDLQRGDRVITINGVDCHVMEVSRALQLCRSSTHVSLLVRFDPNLFHALLDGQNSRQNDTKRHLSQNDAKTTLLTTTHASFASLKPIQQLSSQSLSSSVVAANNANNNWKQKVRQIVQNVTTNNKHNATTPTTTTTTPATTETSPETTPEILKIYYESDFRYLPIHVTTTARECIQLALIEFQLNSSFSSRDFALYEYKLIDNDRTTAKTTPTTTATSAVKRLSDNSQNLVQNLSLDSRIYLKCVTAPSAANNEADVTREISRESHDNSLLSLDGDAIARELMDRDFALFCRIESQQFIYDLTTNDDKSDDRRLELKAFEERTNREMFWTINQILFAANSTQKRVKSVKQLIRVATACKQCQNFNSLFAILSGLSHQSVERQKHALWERMPSRAMQKLHKLYQLMDPSRNFHFFRQILRKSQSPVIPFFPLVKKDLSFIYLANETLVEESKQLLVNWEKMRLLALKVKEVQQMTHKSTTTVTTPTTRKTSTLSSTAAQTLKSALNDSKENSYRKMWEKQRMRKRVQHFLDSSFSSIICDENLLFEKSLECEPQPQSSASQRSSQTTLSSSQSSANNTAHNSAVMPSPTLSSHSSSPSLSSSTTNSSDVQSSSSQQRMRFGVRDDTGLRKLLALSSDISVVHNNHNTALRPLSHCNDSQTSLSSSLSSSSHFLSPHLLNSNYFLSEMSANRAPIAHSMSSHFMKQSLPQESSSVTSLRRLEQLQQMSRFSRDAFLPSFNDSTTVSSRQQRPIGRHVVPPTYDQTIQRMKKKFNQNEENVV